jgi:hypothetical protein
MERRYEVKRHKPGELKATLESTHCRSWIAAMRIGTRWFSQAPDGFTVVVIEYTQNPWSARSFSGTRHHSFGVKGVDNC